MNDTPNSSPWSGNIRSFLTDQVRYATLAVADDDGHPWQAVCWYDVRDDGIAVNSQVGRRWPALVERRRWASVTIFDGQEYVIVRGPAEVTATGVQARREAQAMAPRYGVDPAVYETQERIGITIRPAHVATHGAIHKDSAG